MEGFILFGIVYGFFILLFFAVVLYAIVVTILDYLEIDIEEIAIEIVNKGMSLVKGIFFRQKGR